ncbi:amidohydrolase family protein [Ferrimonas lipolytica]|uniref:Amidohydrolase family protein n=1 Tax=Ferrimonas lipolytica TaxID=2724191 RepID=A0A6H1UE59_9GAMM|nr:amidohydrolase family protein [Ferrimonas lipolytica]QIZ77371.1 amidohydrolase family protein [Ferrimonas lipolytica]
MKHTYLQAIGLLLPSLISPVSASSGQYQLSLSNNTPTLTAFTNGILVTKPGKLAKNRVLVVEGNVITAISDAIPKGAKVIDLKGQYVYAGFIDSYAQYGLDWDYGYSEDKSPQYTVERYGTRYKNTAVHSDMIWADHFSPDSEDAKTWLNNGFTSVHSAWQDGIFQGQGFVTSLAQGDGASLIYKSQSGPWLSFNKGSSQQEYPTSVMGSIALIRQVLAEGQWYKQQFGKPLLPSEQSLLPLTNFDQQAAFFKGSHPDDIIRAAHLLDNNHAIFVGSGLEFERIAQLKQLNSKLILPLSFAKKPEITSVYDPQELTLANMRHWERSPSNIATVANNDIPFALTMDGIDGEDFWPRLNKAMRYGLSGADALAALTTTPAQFLGLESELGQLAPGYRADLVISNGDLFAGGTLVATVLQGQWHNIGDSQYQRYSGEWQLRWFDNSRVLTLTEKDGKLTGKLGVDDDAITLQQLNSHTTELSFQLPATTFGRQDNATVTLVPYGQQLQGSVLLANGESWSLTAEKTKPQQHELATVEPINFVSKQTFPNVAYGHSTLPQAQNMLIRNATVWTSTEQGNLANTDVLVRHGKIDKIGSNLKLPSGYQLIDGSGKHLTAGIIDEHSHIAIHGGVNEFSDNNTAEVRIGDVLEPSDIAIYRSLAGGVTSAQLLHGSANPIGGQAQVIKLRWGQDAQGLAFTAAPPSIKFALGENVKQSNWGDNYNIRYPQTRMGVEAMLRDGFQQASNYQHELTAWDGLSRRQQRRTIAPKPDLRLQTVLEVLNSERHIHIHSYVHTEMLMMLGLADELGFKVQTFTHSLEGYKLASEMAAAGTSAATFADWWAYKFEVYDAIPQNACVMTEQGVLTSIHSDSNDLIRRLNQEAAKSIMYCGMSEQQAWQMVTINPAKQLKVDHLVGSIEAGKQADLVLWSANPLSVYARAEITWIDGARYFSIEQDQQRRRAINQERQQLIAKLLQDDSPAEDGEQLTPLPASTWHCDTVGQHSHQSHSHQQH